MKVFVAGATGAIGRPMIRSLKQIKLQAFLYKNLRRKCT